MIIICVVLIFTAGNVWAQPYYVATTGNDASDGSLATPWLTIQHAIDNVIAGDVINVAAETYVEVGQIVIDKDLTIIGAGKTSTIIKPNEDHSNWFDVNSGVTFNLSKIKLDGTGRVITRAINYVGNGIVNDCWFTQIKGATKYAKGTVVLVNNPAAVNITNCVFDNIGRNGIRHRGSGMVSGNTYTGKGVGDWLDYFILAEFGCNITIDDNTVTNCTGASSDGSTSTALAIWDDLNTTATITNNILSNNTVAIGMAGINSTDPAYPWPNVTIGDGNLMEDGDYGITIGAWGTTYTPTITFGASTLKGQTTAVVSIGDGIGVGATYDISNLIFQDGSGTTITDNFSKEDLVIHTIDADNRALFTWVPNNLFVTANSFLSPTTVAPSIQRGIDAATAGWAVNVAAGTYTENVVIYKSLSLIGADKTTTTIDGNDVGNTVTITASDVTVSDFRITNGFGSGNGVYYPEGGIVIDPDGVIVLVDYHIGSALTEITIENNIIDGNAGNGVYVSSAGDGGATDNIVIRNNQIFNNGGSSNYAGVSLTHPNYIIRDVGDIAEWRRPKNILLQGNMVYENSNYGIYVSAGKNNVIRSNEIWGNSKYGLQLAASWNRPDIPCEYTTVEDNEIYDNTRNGVKLTSWNQYNTFTRNNIRHNGFGYTGSSHHYNYGFLFQDGNDNTIQNNTITNNALGGLYLWGKGDISYDWYSTTNNTITGNTISDHTAPGGQGIYIPAKYIEPGYPPYPNGFLNSHINYNNITNNLAYGLENVDATQTVDATCNWWGNASGPTHTSSNPNGTGDAVSDNITYLPWLVALDGPCASGTLLGDKFGVRDDLAGLLPSGDKKTDKILEKAIKHLEKSLADELWENNDHLSSKGIKVFEEEKTAVHELMKINELDVSASILALVEVDEMLAQIAINEAENEKDKAKAEGEMDKALDEISKGNFDKAIEHYKQAWHQATKALKNLAKSFANSDVEENSELVDSAIPEVFGLGENYPNPFNPTTLISYDLPEASQVTMTVYDMMGRQVKALVQEFQPAGNHSVIWNATNDNGTRMSGGIYFYQIKAGSFLQTHKMILLK